MASSFLDDLFKKEVDEKDISEMVGSLESQLASSAIPGTSQTVIKQESSPSKSNHAPIKATRSNTPPKQNCLNSTPSAGVIRPGISSIPVQSAAATTVVNIAPRPAVTKAVPLAPRPATMTVLSPASGLAGGQRYVTTMINAGLLNRNVLGGSQIAIAPGMVPGSVAIAGGGQNIAPRVIPQIQPNVVGINPVSISGSPQRVVIKQEPRIGTPLKQEGSGHVPLTIAPNMARSSGNTGSVHQMTIPRTSLAQVPPNSSINASQHPLPGSGSFRLPMHNSPTIISTATKVVPSTAAAAAKTSIAPLGPQTQAVASSTPRGTTVGSATPFQPVAQIVPSRPTVNQSKPGSNPQPISSLQSSVEQQAKAMEAIKDQALKLRSFFNNLVRLASDKSPQIGQKVKDLVQNVMEGKLSEEEFAVKLQTTLNSPPQPNLVGFLKKTLPLLRSQSRTPTPLQALQKIQVQPGMPPQKVVQQPISTTRTSSPQISAQAMHVQQMQPQNAHMQKVQIHQQQRPQQILLQKPLTNLTPAQQQQLLQQTRNLPAGQRVLLTTTAAGAVPSGTQFISTTRGLVMVRPGTVVSAAGAVKPHVVTSSAAAAAEKLKHKSSFTGISSSGDDDINDVTSMAGVNLMEESQRILAINSELLSSQMRSCKDECFLNSDPLQKKLDMLVKKHGLDSLTQDVAGMVSHATQERLRNLLEKLSTISLHRVEIYKDDPAYDVGLDLKSQLRVFEQIDEVERKKREAREREVLMRAAKSRSRQEDPEQARLKEKAKQLQQEEEEMLRKRSANATALAAIGPRKKRKLDEALDGVTPNTSSPFGAGTSGRDSPGPNRQQVARQRTRRVILKDLVFVLEQEKETTKSTLLYRALLK